MSESKGILWFEAGSFGAMQDSSGLPMIICFSGEKSSCEFTIVFEIVESCLNTLRGSILFSVDADLLITIYAIITQDFFVLGKIFF